MEKKQFLECPLLEVKVNEEDNFFVFEGYASTFGNEDLGKDIVVNGAFSDTIADLKANARPIPGTNYKRMMPVLWQHQWDKPIGSFVEMSEDSKGLFVKGIMPKKSAFVRDEVMPQMEVGSVADMSIGYIVRDWKYVDDVRYIEKADLYETSIVTIPMNPNAAITGFKSADGVFEMPIADRSDEWGSEEKMGAFIEGDGVVLNISCGDKIIPKAVFKAALDVYNDDDLGCVKHILVGIYEKMGLESPFQGSGSFRLDDEKSLTERELEAVLRGGVCFSKSFAKKIIGLLNDDARRDADVKSRRDAELKENLTKLLNTL